MFVEETGEFANDSFVQRKLKKMQPKQSACGKILIRREGFLFYIQYPSLSAYLVPIVLTINAIERGFLFLQFFLQKKT